MMDAQEEADALNAQTARNVEKAKRLVAAADRRGNPGAVQPTERRVKQGARIRAARDFLQTTPRQWTAEQVTAQRDLNEKQRKEAQRQARLKG